MKQIIKEFYDPDTITLGNGREFHYDDDNAYPFLVNPNLNDGNILIGDYSQTHNDLISLEINGCIYYPESDEERDEIQGIREDDEIEGRIWILNNDEMKETEAFISTWDNKKDKNVFLKVCKYFNVDPKKTLYGYGYDIEGPVEDYTYDDLDDFISNNLQPNNYTINSITDKQDTSDEEEKLQQAKIKHMLPPEEKWRATADFRDTVAHKNAEKLKGMPMAKYHSLIYQEEKQYHPEAEDGDEYKIGLDGNGTAMDYGHIIKESRGNVDFDEVNGIRFTTYCDIDEMHEEVAEQLKETFEAYDLYYDEDDENNGHYVAFDEEYNPIKIFDEQEYKSLEEQYIKENCDFDMSFYDRDYQYLGGTRETLENLEDYYSFDGIPDEYIDLILEKFKEKPDYFDGDYRIDDVQYELYTNDDDIYNAAKHIFATADTYSEGMHGYVLEDGTIILMSYGSDHNEITSLNGIESKWQFVEMGNASILNNNLRVGRELTSAQEEVIGRMIRCYSDDVLYVSFLNGPKGDRSCQYTYPDYRRVFADIDRYYDEGIIPLGENKQNKKTTLLEGKDRKQQARKRTKEVIIKYFNNDPSLYEPNEHTNGMNLLDFLESQTMHDYFHEYARSSEKGYFVCLEPMVANILLHHGCQQDRPDNGVCDRLGSILNYIEELYNKGELDPRTIPLDSTIESLNETFGKAVDERDDAEDAEIAKMDLQPNTNYDILVPEADDSLTKRYEELSKRRGDELEAKWRAEKYQESKKAKPILKETHEKILYRYVSSWDLISMIENNRITLSKSETKQNGGKNSLSLTRTKSNQHGFAYGTYTISHNLYNYARIEFDASALQNIRNVKIKPYDFVYNNPNDLSFANISNGKEWHRIMNHQPPFDKLNKNDEHSETRQFWSQAEERLFLNDDVINNPLKYIIHIDVFVKYDDLADIHYLNDILSKKVEWKEKINFIDGKLKEIHENILYHKEVRENIDMEVAPDEVDTSSFEVQDELQPEIWRDNQLNPQIRLKLLDIADDFFNTLDLSWIKPIDIILTGSICNFNWSKYSDIDLHIIIDFREVSEQTDFVQAFCDAKKNEWNDQHKNLEVFGFPIEMYVQDINAEAVSSGVYSLEKDAWVQEPNQDEMNDLTEVDETKLKIAASSIMTLIDNMEEEFNSTEDKHQLEVLNDKIDHLTKKIKQLRQNGLDNSGEMSTANLVYKVLRRTEYLDKMWNLSDKIYDKVNSIE